MDEQHISRYTGDQIDNAISKANVNTTQIENLKEQIETLRREVDALQAEATAKWVLLNIVDVRSRNNANAIAELQGKPAVYEMEDIN